MPESKHRKNRGKHKRGAESSDEVSSSPLRDAESFSFKELDADDDTLPAWYKATMFGLMILGLLWLIVWYVSSGLLPVQAAGNWNVGIGFGIAMVGFIMTMKWK
ncbi:cell division protein CrgA [Nesterenkonia flava]|uniref:Cell division protein CrgA n=1 Tax=Nesterenkonia flava TaxID=469799 RepID=A0ABU1FW37_9MICC|nr:cell division protein CrgA [Nesterenkonia flava]MDR5712887.1 cell division protein CrgA [Nesterenkonia flava]